MAQTLVQRLMELGTPFVPANELVKQINSGTYNVTRLINAGWVEDLARYLAASLAAGTFGATKAVEYSMVPAVATLVASAGLVAPPIGFGWQPSFLVRRTGTTYYTSFNIDSFRPSYAVTYYVDPVSGSDSNDGLSEASPKLNFSSTITAANAGAVPARFLLKPGVYRSTRAWNNTALNVTALIEPWTADPSASASQIKLVSRSTTTALTWAADTGETYFRASASDPVHVVDLASIDIYGSWVRYPTAVDLATCRATRGTRFWDGTNVYVHAADGRNLVGDPNIDIPSGLDQGNWRPVANAAVLWLQNVAFVGGGSQSILMQPAASISASVYAKNCVFECAVSGNGFGGAASNANSLLETYLVGCVASWNRADGFNYHVGGVGAVARAVEIGCKAGPNGFEPTGINNASTAHETVTVVSINGQYAGSQNRVVHDVNASRRWMLGCSVAASQAADITSVTVGAGSADTGHTVQQWLDGCTIANSATAALYAYAGCAIRYANMNIGALTTGGAGLIEAYAS